MKQTANIIPGSYGKRDPLHVSCFRDGKIVMQLKIKNTKDAEWIAQEWRNGRTMGDIAEIMHKWGIK